MRRAYDALGIQCPTTAAGPTPAGLHANNPQVRPASRLPLSGTPAMPNLAVTGIGGVRALAPNQGQPAPNVSLPSAGDAAAQTAAQQNTVAQTAASLQQNVSYNNPFGLSTDASGQQGLVSYS